MSNDPFAELKAIQREGWSLFAPLESVTTMTAAELVKHARIRANQTVLDVGCGTGVGALTAARAGATVSALDLSPVLIEHGRRHANLAGVEIEFTEGDVEALPYADSTFDVVISQFGHMFAPRPDVTIAEMLRVLRPGGTLRFPLGRQNTSWDRCSLWLASSFLLLQALQRRRNGATQTSFASGSAMR